MIPVGVREDAGVIEAGRQGEQGPSPAGMAEHLLGGVEQPADVVAARESRRLLETREGHLEALERLREDGSLLPTHGSHPLVRILTWRPAPESRGHGSALHPLAV